MKKRLMLALVLILCAMLLASCGNNNDQRFNVGTAQQNAAQHNSSPLDEEDDYTGSEEYWGGVSLPTQAVATYTPAPTVRSNGGGIEAMVTSPLPRLCPS